MEQLPRRWKRRRRREQFQRHGRKWQSAPRYDHQGSPGAVQGRAQGRPGPEERVGWQEPSSPAAPAPGLPPKTVLRVVSLEIWIQNTYSSFFRYRYPFFSLFLTKLRICQILKSKCVIRIHEFRNVWRFGIHSLFYFIAKLNDILYSFKIYSLLLQLFE